MMLAILVILLGLESFFLGCCMYWLKDDAKMIKSLAEENVALRIRRFDGEPTELIEFLKRTSSRQPTVEEWIDFQDGGRLQ